MNGKGALFSLFLVLTLVESSGSSGKMLPVNLGSGATFLYSWTMCSAGVFVLVAFVLSMYLLFEHLAAYNQPEEQKFLVGLILMVPVYALESFMSLLDSKASFNCEIIRDCYEAFALYCFERYLIACLGGEEKTIEFMESQSLNTSSSIPLLEEAYAYGVVEHPFPLNCLLKEWHLGSEFYQAVKIGIVQYMILKMICALLAMVFEFFGVYGDGKFEWKYASSSKGYVLEAYDVELVKQMGIAAVVHLYVFPAVPYKRGERCVRNVAVMTDYASLGAPPDPEEVQDCERSTRVSFPRHDEREKRLNFPQSVHDVVFGSSEIIVDDMKFTVSHVVEPVERGIAKINKTLHQISENVKRFEEQRKKSKDDSYLIPLNSWTKEFSEVHDNIIEGSVSDSGLPDGKRPNYQSKATPYQFRNI
ncbi:hypothetical protein TEA_000044 [Camellia sinensis var. sinensis]|uniref:Uncharacterized protein n=1 Tax=Camellia sinensis var. sinensis TaxID=542762 RepID=A0A4S4EHS6_CAMSN|nr:hypothetical protein TEA_000044 [Camellia sinensis var. sinensis]